MAELAFRQHGAVSVAQLRALGLDRGAIGSLRRRGHLHLFHRGVYAVGHARLGLHGRLWAAVLAGNGPVSHRSAAPNYDLMPTPGGRIEVTTLAASHSTKKLLVHRSRTLDPDVHVIRIDGLPTTTPTRTIQDLAQVLTPHRLQRVLHKAEHLKLLDAAGLAATPPGRRSIALRKGLEQLRSAGLQLTRSELEERMLALLDAHHLPHPQTNVVVEGHEVDFFWPEHGLVVETDGAATHLTPTAFQADRRKDAELVLAGLRVVRFTHDQVAHGPGEVAVTIAALLSLDSARPRWGSRAVKGDGL